MDLNIDIPLSEYESDELPDSLVAESTHGGSVEIGIIGVGQCGGNIAKSFYDAGYSKAVAINTAVVDLNSLDLPDHHKLIIDSGDNKKDGAGKNMKRGEEAVLASTQEIFDLCKRIFGTVDHIMVIYGCGGGTGCGGSIAVINIAKKYISHIQVGDPEKCVGVITTLPSAGELNSGIIKANTCEGLGEVGKLARAKKISTLLIVDNDKISKIYRGLTVKQFWPIVNQTISRLFHVFNKLSKVSSQYSSFDSADYRSIFQCGGCCVMGHAKIKEISDATNVSRALTGNIQKNLLASGMELESAKFAGCIAVGSTDIIENTPGLMDMLNYGFDALSNLIGTATLHRGIYEDDNSTGSLQVFTIIGGLKVPSKILTSLGANVNEIWSGEG